MDSIGLYLVPLYGEVQNRCFRSNGGWLTQIFWQKGPPTTNHSFSEKTRLNDLSYGIKIWTDFSSILSQFVHLTDRQTEFSLLYRICIPCSAVIMYSSLLLTATYIVVSLSVLISVIELQILVCINSYTTDINYSC